MKLFAFLSCCIVAHAAVIREECGAEINGVYYDLETLVSNLDRPFFLDCDHNSYDLYFGYRVKGQPEVSRPGRFNLKTKEFSDIPGVRDGFANAVNHEGKEIFVGGADGIYKFDMRKNKTTFFGAGDKDIWKMYYKDTLFFTSYPEEKLFVFNKKDYSLFEDLKDTIALNFIIDDDNMMYFNNNTGLYRQKQGTQDVVEIIKGTIFRVRALAISPKGKVYVCLDDGLYVVNQNTLKLDKILNIFNAFGLTFDRDGNIIFANSHSVYRLLPSAKNHC